ncbi:MAG TPA: TolC family protein [Candidatus Kapabacteria bacterium]|nr:TolC family protein [Candidatus Kapabacteria bacterium]
MMKFAILVMLLALPCSRVFAQMGGQPPVGQPPLGQPQPPIGQPPTAQPQPAQQPTTQPPIQQPQPGQVQSSPVQSGQLQRGAPGGSRTISLSEAVQMAIGSSLGMAQAQDEIDVAKGRYNEVASYAYPQLAGDASYTRIDPVVTISIPGSPISIATAPNNNYNGWLTLQQAIWAFGRFSTTERVAESGIKSAEDNLDQYRAQAAYQTTQVYYTILTTDESLRVEQDQLKVLRENLGVTQKREEQGTATTLDPLTVRVRISSIQSQIADLTSTRLKQESVLRRLLGLPTGTHIDVTRPAAGAPLPEDLDTLVALASRQRPEVVVAKDAENMARLQIDATKASNDPLLSANITGGVKDGYFPDLNKPTLNWSGNVTFHVPILDGGRTSAQVDQAEANYRIAQAKTEDAVLGIRSDVEQALADVQASRDRLALTNVQIEQAQQAYDIALTRYQNGAATNLDLLTAQESLEQAKLQEAQLMYQFELSQYNLNRSVGTPLW